MWCSPVADYESVNTELTEKYLAATIVFTFAWTAFECAVDTMTAGGRVGRGAKGRDLVASVATGRMPHLRATLLKTLELDRDADFGHRDMRRMLSKGSIPGIAAEYLRQFRNRLIHGDLPKPEPQDWGERSEYVADQDPHLRRFHANTRLLLLLLQTLAIADLDEGQELEAWLEAPTDGRLALAQLQCAGESRRPDEPELELGLIGIASPRFIWG